jgi:uncharacterized protein (TIGR03435 family)
MQIAEMRLTLIAIFFLCVFDRFGLAQTVSEEPPRFEAVSIRPSQPGGQTEGLSFAPGGRFIATHSTLKGLIRVAYNVRAHQISGGPNWLDSERYDVLTRAEGNPDTAHVRLMLQAAFADRFKLVIHRETKNLPLYALVLAKNGPKFSETSSSDDFSGFRIGRGMLSGHSATPTMLANTFSNWVGRSVIDETGLKGRYDFKLEWIPDDRDSTKPDEKTEFQPGSSLFAIVQEQLGLKLEPRKGPVEVLIIDNAEKASEN